jgi:hypothetical protein
MTPPLGTTIRIVYGITEYTCSLVVAFKEIWTGETSDGKRISAPPEFWTTAETKEKGTDEKR